MAFLSFISTGAARPMLTLRSRQQKEQPVTQAVWDTDYMLTEDSYSFEDRLEALEGAPHPCPDPGE